MRYTTLVLATVVKMHHYKQLVVYCMWMIRGTLKLTSMKNCAIWSGKQKFCSQCSMW